MGRPLREIVHEFLGAALRRRYLILVPLLLLPLVGLAVGLLGGRLYESRLTVLVQEPAKLNPFLADLAVGTRLNERMPVLESLARSPFVLGDALVALGMMTPQTPREQREELIRRVSSSLTIDLVGSDLVDLRLRGRSPADLDRLLAEIGRRFIDKLVAPERSSIAGSVAFLEQQMGERRAALAAAEDRLAAFKTEHAVQLPEFHAANVDRLGNLRQLLEVRRTELAGAAATVADLRQALRSMNPVAGHLQEEILQRTNELTLLRARYTDEHSKVQAALRELGRLEEQRAQALAASRAMADDDLDRLWNQAVGSQQTTEQPRFILSQLEQFQAAKARLAALQQEVAQLERATAELEGIVSSQGAVATGLKAIERDLGTEQEVYATLLKRYEMARVTGDLGSFEASQRVMVIQNPDQPSAVGLSVPLFMLAGLASGLALGAGLAITAELADDTVRRRADLERISGLRLLARIPAMSAEGAMARGAEVEPARLRLERGRMGA